MKSKIMSILIAVILVICLVPTTSDATHTQKENLSGFSDVPQNHWAYDAIMWMADNGIAEGVGGGQFDPDREVSRDEYAKMMVLALDLKLINPESPSFKDIKKGGWQYKYVETAKPYMTGFRTASGDYFHPSEPAVREDMAVALVKAMGYGEEAADESVLSAFDDASGISANLKNYIAIAVKHGLMQGYDKDGKRVFDPQASLTRAQAATLLYNALRSDEEKVTYDGEEKVTYGDGDTAGEEGDKGSDGTDSSTPAPVVRAAINGDHVVLSWDRIDSSRFNGYKVVISKNDSTPQYPENGYFAYITDRDTTSAEIEAGDCYNGGDFDGQLKSGEKYYFSVTVLYNDKRVAGNVIRLEMP